MADPLRRTLSKLRGKRSKKGPAGGLTNGEGKEQPGGGGRRGPPEQCNGAPGMGDPVEILLGPPGEWGPQNHNNNNDKRPPALGCRLSHYSNVDFTPQICDLEAPGGHSAPVIPSPYSPDYEEPPHSAPSPLNFIYPPLPDSRGPQEPHGGFYGSDKLLSGPSLAGGSYYRGPQEPHMGLGFIVSDQRLPDPPMAGGSYYRGPQEPHMGVGFIVSDQRLSGPSGSYYRGPQEPHMGVGFIVSDQRLPDPPMAGSSYYRGPQEPHMGVGFIVSDQRLSVPPGSYYGGPQNHSEDSEEEDYYDNENLLTPGPQDSPGPPRTPFPLAPQDKKGGLDIYLETERLRSQLQEAYYLLIHAMHDMPLGPPHPKAGPPHPNGGPRPETCPSSSQDSVYSQSSARVPESDVWSSDEASPQQAPHSHLASAGRLRRVSRSLDAVHPLPERLHKCHSDSQIKYSPVHSSGASSECGHSQAGSPRDLLPMESPPHTPGGMEPEEQGSSSPKPAGLTVRKMQKWMYKGRLLSLEVKERLIGPSPKGKSEASAKADFIENSFSSSVIRRDLKVTEVNQHNLQHNLHNNHITVSKKRNWLTQSSHRCHHGTESHKLRHHPCSHVDTVLRLSRPEVSGKAQETPLTPQAAPAGPSDLSEDNDADDEGEIWYNPIPEDDEPYVAPKTSTDPNASDPGPVESEVPARPCPGEPLSPDNTGDSWDSTDYGVQLCKQRSVCKTAASLSTEDPPDPGLKVTSPVPADFSPPCSPNPVKKSGSINWSLPDKIKSPRTVRKLSMKMKKLPELSRKLSVKGTSWSHSSSDHPSSSSKGNCQEAGHGSSLSSSGQAAAAASRNVISRYHLDSSVSSQHNYKKKSSGTSKSSSKGGYLSDGDSPELIAKSGKHSAESRPTKGKEPLSTNNAKSDLDIDAFRHYSFSDQPKCFQYVSGLMSAHFYGAEDLKPPRIDSKDVFCAIQVDSVNKARTALLTCRTSFLDMDHTFNIELENAQHLKLVVFSWDPTPKKNRVCCHGTVILPALFRVTRTHQLAVKLEPRGLIYVKLSLMEQWENSADRLGVDREPVIFGVDARQVVEKENSGLMVPLLMDKCIVEIEKRGCQVVGLYRLCGSAAVKKELREAFERDSKSVGLCENDYPDINVITGVLKDYLRELPSPLITKQLYEAVLHSMAEKPLRMSGNGCDNDPRDSEHTVELLNCLPDVERATLRMLLDHLKRVASYHEVNKMTCQNLAVCFGPVLLSQRQETSNHNNRVFIDSEELASALDFKKHIEVLHYLLQLWPVKNESSKEAPSGSVPTEPQPCLRRKKPRPQMLNLNISEMSGVLRPRAARLDSPSSNRYAGDWSSCQGSYLLTPKEETDSADISSESPRDGAAVRTEGADEHLQAKEHPLCALVPDGGFEDPDVNLHDLQESIDTLIGNLERELSKNKVGVSSV